MSIPFLLDCPPFILRIDHPGGWLLFFLSLLAAGWWVTASRLRGIGKMVCGKGEERDGATLRPRLIPLNYYPLYAPDRVVDFFGAMPARSRDMLRSWLRWDYRMMAFLYPGLCVLALAIVACVYPPDALPSLFKWVVVLLPLVCWLVDGLQNYFALDTLNTYEHFLAEHKESKGDVLRQTLRDDSWLGWARVCSWGLLVLMSIALGLLCGLVLAYAIAWSDWRVAGANAATVVRPAAALLIVCCVGCLLASCFLFGRGVGKQFRFVKTLA